MIIIEINFFPWLSDKEVEEMVDFELNKECDIYKLFPVKKITEEKYQQHINNGGNICE